MISAVDLVRGVGHSIGLEVIQVPGATGYFDTDYRAKAQYGLKALREKDFLFVHVESTDEAGHMGDVGLKVKAIEDFFHSQKGPLFTKSASFHSVFLRSPVRGGGRPYWGAFRESLGVILEWIEAGRIAPPAITDLGPMTAESVGRAHAMLEKGHTRGKIVLSVG